jgi:hypothetical protein
VTVRTNVCGERVFAGEPTELANCQRNLLVLLQLGRRWQFVVGRVALPFKWEAGLAEQCFDERLEDALSVRAVGEDEDAVNL